jgi:hypothetical protein
MLQTFASSRDAPSDTNQREVSSPFASDCQVPSKWQSPGHSNQLPLITTGKQQDKVVARLRLARKQKLRLRTREAYSKRGALLSCVDYQGVDLRSYGCLRQVECFWFRGSAILSANPS